jgi:hypothetical protein
MKYMILTYASQQDYDAMAGKTTGRAVWSAKDFAAMGAFMEAFNKELAESGELVETRGLAAPAHTRRVQLREGVPVVTDGPFAETTEVLAGYWIVDCASFDRATEIAARLASCPAPPEAAAVAVADVRPIAESRDELEL